MKLRIGERITLMNSLPDKDDFINISLRREVLKKIEFSSDEVTENAIKTIQEGDKSFTTWKETEAKELEFKAAEVTYVMSKLKELSDRKELTSMQLPLYEKFSAL